MGWFDKIYQALGKQRDKALNEYGICFQIVQCEERRFFNAKNYFGKKNTPGSWEMQE